MKWLVLQSSSDGNTYAGPIPRSKVTACSSLIQQTPSKLATLGYPGYWGGFLSGVILFL